MPPLTARLAADAGVPAFNQGFQRWLAEDSEPDLASAVDGAMAELFKIATVPIVR